MNGRYFAKKGILYKSPSLEVKLPFRTASIDTALPFRCYTIAFKPVNKSSRVQEVPGALQSGLNILIQDLNFFPGYWTGIKAHI
jgi:hypothetical protein